MGTPKNTAKIGCFDWKVEVAKTGTMSSHGETCTETKEIIVFKNENEQILKETITHEMLHAICEDIFEIIKDLDGTDKMEESFIRLFCPRFMNFVEDNPEWVKYLWTAKKTKK